MALKKKLSKADLLCRSFSVLEIFETSTSFHIKLFFNLQWLTKNGLFEGCTLCHKFLYVMSHDLFITAWNFSHQGSVAVWNVNLSYLCIRKSSVLNPSLFHIINIEMVWCPEKAFFDVRHVTFKNTLIFFQQSELFFTTLCSHIYQFFDKRNIYQDFCNHTGLHIWSLSDSNRTRTPNHLVCKQTTI